MIGVSSHGQNALLIGSWQTGARAGFGRFPSAWLFMPKRAIGRAKFSAYMLLTHP
jgi:hypothetical protein